MEPKLQAPKGGCYSRENGEWYDGGQFLPDTNMPKGAARKAKRLAATSGNIASLTIRQSSYSGDASLWARMAGQNRPIWVHSGSSSECRALAELVVALATAEYVKRGVVPHPTEIVT